VRKLFESDDTSFTQFVLSERLARAHRLLSDPRFAERSIAALALGRLRRPLLFQPRLPPPLSRDALRRARRGGALTAALQGGLPAKD
jgi:hypothetical protein